MARRHNPATPFLFPVGTSEVKKKTILFRENTLLKNPLLYPAIMEIRIFISSPGDVVAERAIAKRVIRKLQKEFGTAVTLKPLLWEDMPLQSTSTFQEGIDKIVHAGLVDIAIFILWSRLGSPLGVHYRRSDGSFYRSGTEYEYEMMLAANKQTGKPEILAYIKNAPVTTILAGMNDLTAIEEWTEQNKQVQHFIKENFYDKESRTVYGAYHQFEESVSFEQKLTEHLRRLIVEKTGQVKETEWSGNPYMGLKSFEFEDEAVFYGRRRVINEIEELLIAGYASKKSASLIVLGESGSGKSSLVKAGLLPDLSDSGIVPDAAWKLHTVTPAQFGGDVFPGIVKLVADAFPSLKGSRIWEDVQNGSEVNYAYVADFLNRDTETPATKQVNLFFFDQFEELFTEPQITEEMRGRVIALLQGLVNTRKMWFIFSIRSDFYHKFISYPGLLELKKQSIVYDLPVMRHSELQEIVEEPARKAGLKWEVDSHTGNSLKAVIINDITSHAGDLPLIEFALSELYARRNARNELTFEAYEQIGRVDGAIVQYVDNLYAGLTNGEKEIFEHLLSAIVTESASNKGIYVRRIARLAELEKDEAYKQLIAKMVKAHLFVTGKDMGGEPTLTIAHEMLLTSWKVILNWIEKEKSFISLNEYYENCGNYWKESGYATGNLIKGKEAIREAEYFLLHWKTCISRQASALLDRSIRRFYRKYYGIYIGVFVLLAVSLSCLGISVATDNPIIKDYLGTDFPWPPLILMYAVLLLSLLHKLWLKQKALPLYRTVRKSLVFLSVLSALSLADVVLIIRQIAIAVNEQNDVGAAIGQGIYLLVPAFVFFNLAQVVIDYRNVIKWRRRIFSKSLRASRIIRKITAVSAYLLVTLFFIGALAAWGIVLNEKEEKLTKSYEIIDELFDGLNNIQSQLSSRDVLYVNNKRLSYLWENFGDQLRDTVTDPRDYQYALCYYNLGRPDRVPGNLDFGSLSNLYLAIKTYSELGSHDFVKLLVESYQLRLDYSDGHSISEIDADVIWAAEKAGAFEWAKALYDTVQYDLNANPALRINYGHALLMTGYFREAVAQYAAQINEPSYPWRNEIIKDFSILRWSGCSGDTIAIAEKALGLPARHIFTSPADEETTPALAEPLAGEWRCMENGNYIDWEITRNNYNLCFYSLKDTLENELFRAVTHYRLKEEGTTLIIEELDCRQNTLATGILELTDENELHCKIIDNGIPEQANASRIYVRKTEEE